MSDVAPQPKWPIVVLSITAVPLLMLAVWCAGIKRDSEPATPPRDFAKIERAVHELLSEGAIKKIDPAFHEAHISRMVWNLLNIDQRQGLGQTLAYYCGWKSNDKSYWVEIKDFQTGRRLAKWSESWGYTDGE